MRSIFSLRGSKGSNNSKAKASVQHPNSSIQKALEHQECPICFENLYSQPVCTLQNKSARSCMHSFHSACINNFPKPFHCVVCDKVFESTVTVPVAVVDPAAWFKCLDVDSNNSLTYEEIIEGLKAQIPLDWMKIEMDVDRLWVKWDADRNGSISLSEFSDPVNGVIAYLKAHYPQNPPNPPPDITKDKKAWFCYWDEDHSNKLDKEEVMRALIKTFRLYNIDQTAVVNTLDIIWPIFDTDGSGQIDMNEFCSTDNLADTIVAQLLAERGHY